MSMPSEDHICPFAHAFSTVWQFEYSIQAVRNYWAGIFKTASECLRDRDRAAVEIHTKGIGNSTAATEPTNSICIDTVQSFRVYYTSSQVIFSHAPLFLHVSRAARHSRATFHALPNIHSACLAATHTEICLCGAVSEWHGSDRPFNVTSPQTRSVLAGKRCSRMSEGAMLTGCGPCPSCPKYLSKSNSLNLSGFVAA